MVGLFWRAMLFVGRVTSKKNILQWCKQFQTIFFSISSTLKHSIRQFRTFWCRERYQEENQLKRNDHFPSSWPAIVQEFLRSHKWLWLLDPRENVGFWSFRSLRLSQETGGNLKRSPDFLRVNWKDRHCHQLCSHSLACLNHLTVKLENLEKLPRRAELVQGRRCRWKVFFEAPKRRFAIYLGW